MKLTPIFAATALVALNGCASITTDNTQSIRLETVDRDGVTVNGATCNLVNDRGNYEGKSPATVLVRKSSGNLDINCTLPENSEGAATLVSRAGAGMWGNIVFGGGIGAIIDHNKGTAYNYPNWIQVVLGKRLVFDRRNSKDDTPTPGFESGDPSKSNQTGQDAPAKPAIEPVAQR